MTQRKNNGGPAFPGGEMFDREYALQSDGMTLRDWFAGQALSNPAICTGQAQEWDLRRWFGERGGITRAQIVAAQAADYADAMLEERDK